MFLFPSTTFFLFPYFDLISASVFSCLSQIPASASVSAPASVPASAYASSAPVFVPAELPPRYAISFVPAVNAQVSASASALPPSAPAPTSSSDYSLVSSVNFVVPSAAIPVSLSSSCIGTTQ